MIKHLQGSVVLLAPYREQTAEVYYFLLVVVVVVMWGAEEGLWEKMRIAKQMKDQQGSSKKKDRML